MEKKKKKTITEFFIFPTDLLAFFDGWLRLINKGK